MRRLTRLAALVSAAAVVGACANRAMQPPGGPVADKAPPIVVLVTPESGSVNKRPGAVDFRFDKVISDAPAKGQLDQYFLISPWDGAPRINWHRDHIDVRPRHSFRQGTAYTVTLLPGLADVRGNAMTQTVTTLFSTGATFPRFGVIGTIFDWATEKPAGGAIVEAISRPDSTVYIAVADSLGQFTVGPFDAGRYTLLGFLDRNGNRGVDNGEAWDSTSILINTSRPVVELLAIVKDTIPPRIAALAKEDSATLRVTFDRAIDPNLALTPALFRLQRADSTVVPLARAIGARAAVRADSIARADSIRRDSIARRDTTRRETTVRRDTIIVRRDTTVRRDTSAAARAGLPRSIVPIPLTSPGPTQPKPAPLLTPPLPRPSRPAPETMVLLKLAPPALLEPGATYRLTASGVRGILGRSASVNRTVTIPKPPPPSARDSAAKRDTTRTPPPRKPPDSNR